MKRDGILAVVSPELREAQYPRPRTAWQVIAAEMTRKRETL
jgi:hypothetical protein